MADGSTRLRLRGRPVVPFIGVGAFAEYAVVGELMLVAVPSDAYRDALALLACGGITGVGAVRNVAKVRPGDTVLVVGCGGVGLNVIQGAALAGAGRVIAMDKEPGKLEVARLLGATDVLAAADDVAVQVRVLQAAGVDHAFDVTGAPGVTAAAMAATRPGGTTVMVGSPTPGSLVEISPQLLFGGRTLRGCVGGNAAPAPDLPLLVELGIRGRLQLEPLISERIPLERVNEALERQRAGEGARSLIVFDEG